MLPESIAVLGNSLRVYVWVAVGIVAFHVLEQFLHWHHCHRPVTEHRPLGYLVLAADGLHNLVGGVAVGSAFIVDIRLGIVTWLVAAAHEVPQEIGDFGILVHSGWNIRHALAYNVASALTFPVGGLLAYALAGQVDVAVLVPFAAGNFIYIALADLLPELTTSPVPQRKIVHTACFVGGLLFLALPVDHGDQKGRRHKRLAAQVDLTDERKPERIGTGLLDVRPGLLRRWPIGSHNAGSGVRTTAGQAVLNGGLQLPGRDLPHEAHPVLPAEEEGGHAGGREPELGGHVDQQLSVLGACPDLEGAYFQLWVSGLQVGEDRFGGGAMRAVLTPEEVQDHGFPRIGLRLSRRDEGTADHAHQRKYHEDPANQGTSAGDHQPRLFGTAPVAGGSPAGGPVSFGNRMMQPGMSCWTRPRHSMTIGCTSCGPTLISAPRPLTRRCRR